MPVNPEYLRRNLLIASAVGANANAQAALKRLRGQKRPAKWLVAALEGIEERTAKLPGPLACYRSAVPVNLPIVRCEPHELLADIPGMQSHPTNQP